MLKLFISRTGYTLAELMATLLILGVVAGLSFPVYTASMEQARAADAVNKLWFIYRVEKKAFQETGSYVPFEGSNWAQYHSNYDHPYASRWLGMGQAYAYDITADSNSFTATATREGGTKTFTINEAGVLTETGSY